MDAKDYIRIFEQSSELLVVIDTNFGIVAASDAFLKATSTIRENIVGCNAFNVFPDNPNDKTANGERIVRASFNRVINNKTEDVLPVVKYDIPKPESAGGGYELKYWQATNSPILDENNNVKYIVHRTEDVTENKALLTELEFDKKALKLLEDSDKRYNMMLMKSPFGFAIFKGKNMVITLANDSVKEMWGKGKDVEGKSLFEVIPELNDTEFPDLLENVYATGVPFCGDELLAPVFRNGKLEDLYFNFVYQPYLEADETISGVTVIAYEVTEQVIAKSKIEESEKKYRTVLTSIDQGFTLCEIIRNKEGKAIDFCILEVNATYEEQTGVSKETVLGKRILQTFPSLTKWMETYAAVVDNQCHAFNEHYFEDTDRWFENKAYPVGEDKFAVLFRDITERKHYESKLIEAKESAENAVRSKQQFLSNMSHEIRTPMNAIIGFTNVLLKSKLEQTQEEYLTAIKVSGDALLVLIDDILDLAKVDAGKMTFEQTPFMLAASLSAMLQLFDLKIKEKNLELATQFDTAIPEIIMGDSMRLRQIILNLISNAVKFTEVGKITMSVSLLQQDAEKVTIEFTVTDTGIGIHKNKLEHIFEDFGQATYENSRLYGGTGLGLAIVKKLIKQQGGTIHVESEFGKGSVFSFQLSFAKTNQKIACETEHVFNKQVEVNNIKVLVAEDMPLNQLLIKIILTDFGFEVDIADNGKIAIEKLHKKKYDLVLMDLQMPEMNGYDATAYLRNTMKSNIPIIALTADVTSIDVEKAKAVGMNDYISKPVDEQLLYDKIIKALQKTD